MSLRYKSEGEVHKDFHGLTCASLHYLVDNYGIESVREILANTAQKVYKTIHEALKQGHQGRRTILRRQPDHPATGNRPFADALGRSVGGGGRA